MQVLAYICVYSDSCFLRLFCAFSICVCTYIGMYVCIYVFVCVYAHGMFMYLRSWLTSDSCFRFALFRSMFVYICCAFV